MNVTEFAEQIVFGTSLDEKLKTPGKLTMEVGQAPRVERLIAPGRSAALAMHDGPGVSQPPKDSELENETSRGRLLHFLANHELLATELMALVLLKFPEAPHAFKRGVLVTLQEEQEHTRMYMQRMRECGVEFGSFPLSGHFWRVVEPMQSPMDFVSRLSLTFEQANLDYSLHFASVFERMGDTETARILSQIYQDEIGHVQHGLHWFRQWKNPELSDWDAYQDALQFPMSPQRGRGPSCSFNREGRQLAGLSDEYIDAIEVFRQSRGRPPTVRWFDAGIEAELEQPVPPKQQALLRQLSIDLEGAMIPLARQDDVQLVRQMPSVEFRKQLLHAGLDLPEFVPLEQAASLNERRLSGISPWAWTPNTHAIADSILPASQRDVPVWHGALSDLFRKSWIASRVPAWLDEQDTPTWMAGSTPNCIVATTNEVAAALEQLRALGFAKGIFKLDLATSGRGQRQLDAAGLAKADRQWLDAIWKTTKAGVVEPELDRLLDISFLWEAASRDSDVNFIGWTRPLVTQGRRYCGTKLSRPFADCDAELKRFLLEGDCRRLRSCRDWLLGHLVPELRAAGFDYYFGVDAIVHRARGGELKIHPLVELNPRLTMGHIALALRRYIAPNVTGEFRILTMPEWEALGKQNSSLSVERSPAGRWCSGVVALSQVSTKTKLVPAVVVNKKRKGYL